jgi:predicted GNAT family N-acyltransferase
VRGNALKMEGLEIRTVRDEDDLKAVFLIREEVFIKGQGVPKEIEMDTHDGEADHVIALLNGKPVGCARIRFIRKGAKLERIAILQAHRGKHYGRKLVSFLLKYCASKGVETIFMNSQYHVRDYYKMFGFRETGEPFTEAGIKHIKMVFMRDETSFTADESSEI